MPPTDDNGGKIAIEVFVCILVSASLLWCVVAAIMWMIQKARGR